MANQIAELPVGTKFRVPSDIEEIKFFFGLDASNDYYVRLDEDQVRSVGVDLITGEPDSEVMLRVDSFEDSVIIKVIED